MATSAKRFRAFISYSQRDKAAAQRLHKALETYRIPNGVSAPGIDAKSRRIGRIFRDDDEMGASADLGATLRGALEDTEALIVICSRRAAKSQWVNQEIIHFKRTGRADRIFAVIIDGVPNATRDSDQCFPPALRFEVDASGQVTDRPSEPLGLDLRTQPFERVRVRLIAGLLGINFDELWNRDRRRKQRNTTLAALGGGAAAAALGVAGFFWLQDREGARLQQIDRALAEARADAGEGRVAQALQRLRPYLSGDDATQVSPTLAALLGWATPIAEQVAAHQPPLLLAYRGSVVFFNQGQFAELPDVGVAPQRVLLSSDRRRLVVIGAERTVVLNAETGAVLSQTNNNDTDWDSHAFETPDGLIVVLGVRPGSTNGSVSVGVLTVPADGANAQAIGLASLVSLRGVWLGGVCDALLVDREDAVTALGLSARGVTQSTYADANAPEIAAATLVWRLAPDSNPFSDSPFGSFGDQSDAGAVNPFTEIGCASVAADSGDPELASSRVAITSIGGAGSVSTGFAPLTDLPLLFRPMPAPADDPAPGGDNPVRRLMGVGFWRALPAPRGTAPETPAFDTLGGQRFSFIEDRANAGTRWAVCRVGGACADIAVMHNEARSYENVRSPAGDYLLLAQAGALFDVARLRIAAQDLPTDPGSAFDFEPDRAQLTIVTGGEIVAYRPNTDGDWTRAEEVAGVSLPAGDAGFAGLIALGGGEYLIAREDGRTLRIGRDGRARWQINYAGLGAVAGLRYSANRRYAALVGSDGLRVIEVETGLALSGALRPPGWRSDPMEVADCVGGVHVGDAGEVRVICMSYDDPAPRAATWSPQPFEGDIAARIEAMLCDADQGLSAAAALARCLGT